MSFEIKTIFEYYSVSYFTKYLSKCFLEFSDVAALTYYSNMHLIGIFCIKDMRHDMIFDHVNDHCDWWLFKESFFMDIIFIS